MYGWQQRLKYKMHNYRAKLKSRKYAYPEIEVNTLKRKQMSDAAPAKNVKRPKKAEIKEEFRRITTISLEQKFMLKLDGYTPRLLQLMRAKGGAAGTRMRHLLSTVNESQCVEKKRDAVVCCLIEYLGEHQEELFQDCQMEDVHEGNMDQTMKVLVVHNPAAEEDPADVLIVIEGNKVLNRCGYRTKACVLLMGLIYVLNLEYSRNLKIGLEMT
ncbi:hypothetical protein PFLUV_G00067490 [Perca fluviatilis]|uniref:Uncharacterized protein n=1 Tax=Perca fluviatilis TaxID=8168 RepID=A0A6A5FG31_PERFL|nr:hypothetical protein PFLUV_G00067490 [Perca fluviatilis]